MSETLTANIRVSLDALLKNVVSDGTAQFQMDGTGFVNGSLSNGTGADQGDQLYDEVTTLVASGTLTLSVHNFGAAVDQLGQVRSVANVRLIALQSLGNRFCTYVSKIGTIDTAGTGYLINDILTFSGGTGTAAKARVIAVGGGGAVTQVALEPFQGYTGGSYTSSPTTTSNALSGGTGSGLTVDLTLGTYDYTAGQLFTVPVFTDTDALTFGGDGATSALTSLFGTNTDKFIIPGGTQNMPGTLFLCGGGATAWAVGSLSTNRNIKVVNTGANPVTFRLIIIGS